MPHAQASDKETRILLRQAERQKWTVSGGGSRHFILRCPNRCRCQHVMGSSISNAMALRRARTRLINQTCWKEQRP